MKPLSILFWLLALCNGIFGQTPFDKRKADADACMRKKDYDCAIQNYKTCLAIRPDKYCKDQLKKATDEKEFARFKAIADGCFRSKRFDCAIQNYSSCLAIRSDNYCQSQKAMAERERAFYRYQAKADECINNEEYECAAEYYQKCLDLRPDTYAQNQKHRAEKEISFRESKSMARHFLDQKDYVRAIAYLNSCLDIKADEECRLMLKVAIEQKDKIDTMHELQVAVTLFEEKKRNQTFQILTKYLQRLKTCTLPIDEITCAKLQLYTGIMYDTGEGVQSENNAEAIVWYELSANRSNANAFHNLGTMHEKGEGVKTNLQNAYNFYQKAIQLGYDSKTQLKRVTKSLISKFNNEYNAKRYDSAKQIIEPLLADLKNCTEEPCRTAHFNVGYMYQQNLGFTKDINKAKEYYQMAVQEGSGLAMNNLAVILGQEGKYTDAMAQYKNAVALGVGIAAKNIGGFYENGQGVSKDPCVANQWYEKAISMGYKEAKTEIERVNSTGLVSRKIYYNADWKKINSAQGSSYYRILQLCPIGGLYPFKDYYNSGQVQMEGQATKISDEIEASVSEIYTGKFTYYYSNGKIKSIENYRKGELQGSYEKFFDDGTKEYDATYVNDEQTNITRYNTFTIKNAADKKLNFELSEDGNSWKAFTMESGNSEKHYFEGKKRCKFRIQTENKGYQEYWIDMKESYKMEWNTTKACWDIFKNKP